MRNDAWLLLMACACLFRATTATMYRPRVKPREYYLGDEVSVRVDALTSIRTQIPVEYYSLPFCAPEMGMMKEAQTIGEFLEGTQVENSPYLTRMSADFFCRRICQVELQEEETTSLKWHIDKQYHFNFYLDRLPAAAEGVYNREVYANGFPIGFTLFNATLASDEYFLFNHLNFIIDYHVVERTANQETKYQIVEFAVSPVSIQHRFEGGHFKTDGIVPGGYQKVLKTCPDPATKTHIQPVSLNNAQKVRAGETVLYTYDVLWRESEKKWSSRWDIYLTNDYAIPLKLHWYSAINSVVCMSILALMILALYKRVTKPLTHEHPQVNLSTMTLGMAFRMIYHQHFSNSSYTSVNNNGNEAQVPSSADQSPMTPSVAEEVVELAEAQRREERNWRKLHGDVFRPPSAQPGIFCAIVGVGFQLTMTCLIVVALAALGFTSQAIPGSVVNSFLLVYCICGFFAGYVSYRLYASFGGGTSQMKDCVKMIGVFFPGAIFLSFLLLDLCLSMSKSSVRVEIITVGILIFLWIFFMLPLVFLGAYLASRQDTLEYPTHTNPSPRFIPPPTKWFGKIMFSVVLGGLIPSGALYLEGYFIMSSIWMRQYYYTFGVGFVIFVVSLLSCGLISMLTCYFQLCFENHRWWWFSFSTGAFTSVYISIYAFIYRSNLSLDDSLLTHAIYFLYNFWIVVSSMLIFGSTSVLSTLFFLNKLYSTLELDDIEVEERQDNEDEDGAYLMLNSLSQSSQGVE